MPRTEAFKYVVADVFTDTPLEGNPVAVFTDGSRIPEKWMQRIARELNLSETVFVLPPGGDADVRVRIFTPVNELPFAGHPTLGTAIVLGETISGNSLRMETAVGVIPFTLVREGDCVVRARMLQPIPSWEPNGHAATLLSALGVDVPVSQVVAYRNGPRHVFVPCCGIAELAAVEPDLRTLARLPDMSAICFAGSGSHWRMRMFSPAYGVAEDAATGSAAGPLAVHLIRQGHLGYGQQIEIHQGVEMGRPSTLLATVHGEGERIDSIEVAGAAVIVMRGELRL
ncbi:MAG: trans-2,3-dihydro-3-hydroxyanthranilate isomerase [Micromonosporaceae bacterium]|nr:trans-2,3-dihydro-3-hydroxyanthranilate isomerase [Micromonosporaceae bacterium]